MTAVKTELKWLTHECHCVFAAFRVWVCSSTWWSTVPGTGTALWRWRWKEARVPATPPSCSTLSTRTSPARARWAPSLLLYRYKLRSGWKNPKKSATEVKSPLYKHKCPYLRNKLSKCFVFVNPVIFFLVFVCIKTFCSSERSECGSAALSVTSVGLFHQKRGNFPPRIGSKIILDAFKFFLTCRPSFRFISVLSVDPSQFGRRK